MTPTKIDELVARLEKWTARIEEIANDPLIEWVEVAGIKYATQQEVAHEVERLRERVKEFEAALAKVQQSEQCSGGDCQHGMDAGGGEHMILCEKHGAQQTSEAAEPVAWIFPNGKLYLNGPEFQRHYPDTKPLYAAPPSTQAAVQATIERCAKVCDEHAATYFDPSSKFAVIAVADCIRALSAADITQEAEQMREDAGRWRYWRSVWFDLGMLPLTMNYKRYRAILNAGDIETVEHEIDAARSKNAKP